MVNVYINYEKKFAFVEFRTGAHASASCPMLRMMCPVLDEHEFREGHLRTPA